MKSVFKTVGQVHFAVLLFYLVLRISIRYFKLYKKYGRNRRKTISKRRKKKRRIESTTDSCSEKTVNRDQLDIVMKV